MVTTYDIFRFSQKENRLTAQLMLALEMNKNSFLKRFLELCQLDNKINSLDSIEIRLQSFEEESTPDAVLSQDGERILFIESKLRGAIDKTQLISHVRSGKGNTLVVCISSGKREPEEIEETRENLIKQGFSKTLIRWIGWQQIYTELNSLPRKVQEKSEVKGLLSSLENEDLASLTFRGFTRDELVGTSEFAKRYPEIFQNAKQLIESVVEYVQEKDKNVEVLYKSRRSTTSPLMPYVMAGFSYEEIQGRRRWIYVTLTFDFSKACLQLGNDLQAKQLKRLDDSQIESIWVNLKKRYFKFEMYKQGNLTEIEDIEILKQLPDTSYVFFSRYYFFDDDTLYTSPQELVKLLGDEVLWILNFRKTKGAYSEQEIETES